VARHFAESILCAGNQSIAVLILRLLRGARRDFKIMHPLDNLIWTALGTRQVEFVEGSGHARRFPPAVTALGALSRYAPEGYEALAHLQRDGETTALFLDAPADPPSGWKVMRSAPLMQLVLGDNPVPYEALETVALGAADAPEMVALAELTKPGPFGMRTHELGSYLGVRRDGRLAAMAGERLRVPGYTEISAVCTHPEHTGKGHARALMGILIEQIRGRGERPFLHVRTENTRALELYKRMGFSERVVLHLIVVRKPS